MDDSSSFLLCDSVIGDAQRGILRHGLGLTVRRLGSTPEQSRFALEASVMHQGDTVSILMEDW